MSGGLPAVVDVIEQRAHQPGASLYLVTDVSGRILAGNVSEVAPQVLTSPGTAPIIVRYERYSGDVGARTAMVQVVRLPGGFLLLVGRDIGEREQFRQIVSRALGAGAGADDRAGAGQLHLRQPARAEADRFALRRQPPHHAGRPLRRLEVTGTGDEFDRLADAVNAMLDRIEHLIYGVKDVSDNIAHDLKTPLTRAAQSRRGGARREPRHRGLSRGAGDHHRGVGPAHPDVQRAADDLAHRGGLAGRRHDRDRRQRGGARRGRALRAGRRRGPASTSWWTRREPIMIKASRELLGQALANLVGQRHQARRAGAGRNPAAARLHLCGQGRRGAGAQGRRQRNRGFRRRTASARCSASCGWRRAARSRAAGLGLSLVAAVARPAPWHHRAWRRQSGPRGDDAPAAEMTGWPRWLPLAKGASPALFSILAKWACPRSGAGSPTQPASKHGLFNSGAASPSPFVPNSLTLIRYRSPLPPGEGEGRKASGLMLWGRLNAGQT